MLAKGIFQKLRAHYWILIVLFAANISMGWLSYRYYHAKAAASQDQHQKNIVTAGIQILNSGFSISEYLRHFSDRR